MPLFFLFYCLTACNNTTKSKLAQPPPIIIAKPETINEDAAYIIKKIVDDALLRKGKLNDSLQLQQLMLVNKVYAANGYQPIWGQQNKWNALADSLFQFITSSKYYGLFPNDYFFTSFQKIKDHSVVSDSLNKTNDNSLGLADVLLTDAYLNMAKHLKLGRLPKDSVTIRVDSLVSESFFLLNLQQAVNNQKIKTTLEQLEPSYPQYIAIKHLMHRFVDSATFEKRSYVFYPNKDSTTLVKQVVRRLAEEGLINKKTSIYDSMQIQAVLYKYQKRKGIKPSGLITEATVRSLNANEWEKFKRIAINLDRFKQLPDSLPSQYIWVNLPSFMMQLRDKDSIVFQSKVVVGKPVTRTPLLNSFITDMTAYPQWTIPNSIIAKEILPGLKNDPAYLARKGLMLLNTKDEPINAYEVNWEKYTHRIPYRVVQGSGDDNALGVIKFNFNNKYSVYLHDTNQRYFFKNSFRALSHGCVRIQDWQKLAYYLIERDGGEYPINDSTAFNRDTLDAWLLRKERHVIAIKNPLPIYIRYFTCEAKEGTLKFYDDIYDEDKRLTERYFAYKQIF
jgi:L,D-transpeptidase YcbB